MKLRITGTQSLALAKSRILTRLPVRRCPFPTARPSWLSPPTAVLGAKAEPRGWVGHRQELE